MMFIEGPEGHAVARGAGLASPMVTLFLVDIVKIQGPEITNVNCSFHESFLRCYVSCIRSVRIIMRGGDFAAMQGQVFLKNEFNHLTSGCIYVVQKLH
jgi:hypothetical protein